MKNVTLARLGLDGNHITGLGYTLAEARLAAGLQQGGLAARLYTGKPEGQVAEIARQLARTRTGGYLFTVTDHSAIATLQLAEALLRLRPDLRFFFWAVAPISDAVRLALEAAGEIISAGAPETAASQMLGDSDPADPAARPSPYLDGLLAAEDVYRVGLSADQPIADLLRELTWLEPSGSAAETPIPVDAAGLDEPALLDLCRALATASERMRFALRIEAGKWSEALGGLLTEARIVRLDVVGDAVSLTEQARALGVAVAEQRHDEDAARMRSEIYARNGYITNRTGLYFDANPATAIYHLELPVTLPQEERRQAYEWAASHMAIRSAALLSGPDALLLERLGDFAPAMSRETSGWPKHVYAVASHAGGRDALHVDGDSAPAARMRHIPFATLTEADVEPDTTLFVTVRTAADVAEMEARLDRLHRTGVMRIPHPAFAVHFENSCRWFGLGSCKIAQLRRLQVDAAQRVTTCRDSAAIGTVGDSLEKLAVTVRQQVQLAQVERGCADCPVRDHCSQCVSLPEEWGGRFCDIRRAFPLTPLFFEVRAIAHYIRASLPSGERHLDVRLSCEGLPAQHYDGPAGRPRSGERPVLIGIGDRVFAWWRGTTRLFRLSEPLALMAEGWWLGAADADVIAALVGRFGVDEETARSAHAEGLNKLIEGGVIHG